MSMMLPGKLTAESQAAAPWLRHYPACVPAQLDYPAIPAWGFLERSARNHPDRTACIYYKQRLNYRELSAEARRVAETLQRLGVRPGDRVGILLPNTPEFLAALNGTWMAGGIAVAISPLMVAEEVSDLLELTECRIIISLDVLAPTVLQGKFRPDHVLLTTLQDRLPAWQRIPYAIARMKKIGWRAPADGPKRSWLAHETENCTGNFEPIEPATLDEPAFILATGGTTGCPKAVTLSHRNLVANAHQIHHWAGAAMARDSILAVVPFFHSYGLSTCAMSGMAMAATMIMHHRFVPKIVHKLIETHEPTVFPAVPAMLVALNEMLKAQPVRYRALRYCISGGAPLDPTVGDEFASLTGATVVEGFGLSEASPVTHSGPLDGTARHGTIGLPLPDTMVRIVDVETGRVTLPHGEVGELIVKGPQVMLGYWKNPEATSQTIRDGWLFTGDMATCDQDGFFRIVDRKKDLIITSGFNVYPTDVEQVLRRCPGVQDLAIVGVPNRERGELVKAVVVPANGEAFSREVFEAFAKEHLAKHKRPLLIEIIEGDLPRNFLGKVYRRKLRSGSNANDLPSEMENNKTAADPAA